MSETLQFILWFDIGWFIALVGTVIIWLYFN